MSSAVSERGNEKVAPPSEGAVRLPGEKGPEPGLGGKNILRQGNTTTDGTVVEVDGACVWDGEGRPEESTPLCSKQSPLVR